jgi:hypothetical protein
LLLISSSYDLREFFPRVGSLVRGRNGISLSSAQYGF